MATKSKAHRHQLIYNFLLKGGTYNKQDTNSIKSYLENFHNITISGRTIERDLLEMSEDYKLISEGNHPRKWFADPEVFNPSVRLDLTPKELEVIMISLESMKANSPESIRNKCSNAMASLYGSLSKDYSQQIRNFHNKFAFSSGSQGRANPIDDKVTEKVIDALNKDVCFYCFYNKEGEDKKLRFLAPIFIQFSGGTPYLYARDMEKNGSVSKTFNLIRMERVEVKCDRPIPMDIERSKEIEKVRYSVNGFGIGHEEYWDIRISCKGNLAQLFKEKKLHPSQKEEQINEDTLEVSLKVAKSDDIPRLLVGHWTDILEVSPREVVSKVNEIMGVMKKIAL